MKLQKRCGEVDQPLDEQGGIALRRMALPERLPDLMRFPKVKAVEEVDPVKVALQRRPRLRPPERMDLRADDSMAVAVRIADRMGMKAGDKAISGKGPLLSIPGKEP